MQHNNFTGSIRRKLVTFRWYQRVRVVSYENIEWQAAFPVWSVCLFVSFDGDRNIERKRDARTLSPGLNTRSLDRRALHRDLHIVCNCVSAIIYTCVCARVSWLRGYVAFPRRLANKVSLRDVTQNAKNEIRFDEHLRTSNDHTYICMYIYAHILFYSRDVLTLVIPHGEARITEIRLPHAPS